MLTLYTYWRSTTSYRVRIALAMKGLDYTSTSVNLVAGDQREDAYTAINPVQGVPALQLEDGRILTQSMAILDYLDRRAPEPALLPQDDVDRARVLAASLVIATDIHPVNNLKVVNRLKAQTDDPEASLDWMRHWMVEGFRAFDALIDPDTAFCFGDQPTLADICLVPQLYNAHRWGLDLAPFPKVARIEQHCLELPEIHRAHPDQQPEAQEVS